MAVTIALQNQLDMHTLVIFWREFSDGNYSHWTVCGSFHQIGIAEISINVPVIQFVLQASLSHQPDGGKVGGSYHLHQMFVRIHRIKATKGVRNSITIISATKSQLLISNKLKE